MKKCTKGALAPLGRTCGGRFYVPNSGGKTLKLGLFRNPVWCDIEISTGENFGYLTCYGKIFEARRFQSIAKF